MPEVTKVFGANLTRLLREQGISQRKLAERLGVDECVVSRWINGRSLPRSQQWSAIRDVLGISFVDLVNEGTAEILVEMPSSDIDEVLARLAESRGFLLVKKK